MSDEERVEWGYRYCIGNGFAWTPTCRVSGRGVAEEAKAELEALSPNVSVQVMRRTISPWEVSP